jgi:hypothetical protein
MDFKQVLDISNREINTYMTSYLNACTILVCGGAVVVMVVGFTTTYAISAYHQ